MQSATHRAATRIVFAVAVAVVAVVVAACSGNGGEEPAFVHVHDDGTEHVHDGSEPDPSTVEPEETLLEASGGEATVVVANSPGTLVVGTPQRLMTALPESSGGGYLGSGFDAVEIVIRPINAPGGAVEQRMDGVWLAADTAGIGLYLTTPTFDAPGIWEVRVETEGQDIGGAPFEVVDDTLVPVRGTAAPASVTPTAADADGGDLTTISTDPDPEPSFYALSVADAVSTGLPTVVVFATPAFCQTALCGPTMEIVKAATDGRDGTNVVHVEPFDLAMARTGALEPVPAMIEWNLPTEPWVFVVDGDGIVSDAFEGMLSTEELVAALERVS